MSDHDVTLHVQLEAMNLTRQDVLGLLARCGLDDFDHEDVVNLVDVLAEAFDAVEIMTFLSFHDPVLGTTPVLAVMDGHTRQVIQRARMLVSEVSSA